MMFFDKLKTLCDTNGISMTELTKKLGIASSNVTDWGKGSSPRPKTIKMIADFFGVDIGYFSGTTFTNNGIVGNGNKNNTITVGGAATRQLSELEQELLHIFGKLNTMKKAELLVSAKKLLGE